MARQMGVFYSAITVRMRGPFDVNSASGTPTVYRGSRRYPFSEADRGFGAAGFWIIPGHLGGSKIGATNGAPLAAIIVQKRGICDSDSLSCPRFSDILRKSRPANSSTSDGPLFGRKFRLRGSRLWVISDQARRIAYGAVNGESLAAISARRRDTCGGDSLSMIRPIS